MALRRQRWTGVRIAQTTGLSRHPQPRPRPGVDTPHPPLRTSPSRRLAAPRHQRLARIAKLRPPLTGDPRDETRGAGWEMLHGAIDDHSRIASTALYANERADAAVHFLRAAVAYYRRLGIRRVLTDKAPCDYWSAFARTGRQLGRRHLRTRTLHPAHQWQCRTLHPDRPARVGLCPHLPELSRSRRRTLAAPVQLAPPACWSGPVTTYQPFRSLWEQPLETPDLQTLLRGCEKLRIFPCKLLFLLILKYKYERNTKLSFGVRHVRTTSVGFTSYFDLTLG